MYSFGPVPSRRLGQSLGINNIPPKVCTFSCVYCQVGRTTRMAIDRRVFYDPENVVDDVRRRSEKARRDGERIDYLTFVPDGEPTLDVNLGREISLLRPLGIPIGVITNGSLVWREDVREDLAKADWISLKVDAVRESVWRGIDRPHKALKLEAILQGMLEFSKCFKGKMVTETMLVEGHNDGAKCLEETAVFLRGLRPSVAYLSVPTRPPAEPGIQGPDEEALNRAFQIFSGKLPRVEYLIGYEGDAFASTGDVAEDILSITAVHPMRKEAVAALLSRTGTTWEVVDRLLARGELAAVSHKGSLFYLRRAKHEPAP
ncbi:MAG: radical SAM protein [Candidatus Aminicenantes bacterium]|nr:radical SAM protein [Candidatus Aminicenantes bacterium]